jgi:hypothetical protein
MAECPTEGITVKKFSYYVFQGAIFVKNDYDCLSDRIVGQNWTPVHKFFHKNIYYQIEGTDLGHLQKLHHE